jgi:hemerythrin-like domain-containing protein
MFSKKGGRKMRPTEQLKEEHKVIKHMLNVLAHVSKRLESGGEVSGEHLERIVDFIRTFADKCHHGKEEDLLFKAMEEAGVPKEGGPIAVMLTEHDQGRGYVKGMAEAGAEFKQGKEGAGKKFAANARNYVLLLTQHIDKENNILYQIADMHLSGEKQEELLRLFEKLEAERIGPGKHEEYHELVHQLEKIYP